MLLTDGMSNKGSNKESLNRKMNFERTIYMGTSVSLMNISAI